jgi:hypothetical protein
MPDLFETEDERVVRLTPPQLYTWLCYRASPAGHVSHALWQAPSANADEWLARINLLNVTVPKKTEDAARPAKVDPKTKMKLRDDVQQLIDKAKKKNDDDK